MGSAQGSLAPEVKHLAGLKLSLLDTKRLGFQRLCYRASEETFFITRSQFVHVFGESAHGARALKAQFRVYDIHNQGVVPSLDLFGSLALLANDKLDTRLRFIMSMGHQVHNGMLNRSELAIRMYSAARGVARLKRLPSPTMAIVQELVQECFSEADDPYLSVHNIIVFLQTHKQCAAYFSSIASGAAQSDAGDIVGMEARLLEELAQIDARIDMLSQATDTFGEDGHRVSKGDSSVRGGGLSNCGSREQPHCGHTTAQQASSEVTDTWNTLPRNRWGNVRLGVTTILQLARAAGGSTFTPAEASLALLKIPQDQVGTSSLQDFMTWWETTDQQRPQRVCLPYWKELVDRTYKSSQRLLRRLTDWQSSLKAYLHQFSSQYTSNARTLIDNGRMSNKAVLSVTFGHMKEVNSTVQIEVTASNNAAATMKSTGGRPSIGTVWMELTLKPDVSEAQAAELSDRIWVCLEAIPQSIRSHIFTDTRVSVTEAMRGGRTTKHIRLELHRGLPDLGIPALPALKALSLRLDLGLDFQELVRLTGYYADLLKRLSGAQEDELGEEGIDAYYAGLQQRQSALLHAAEAAYVLDISPLKTQLLAQGLHTSGTWAQMRARLNRFYLLQADRLGLTGGLSALGKSVARTVFRRLNIHGSNALTFADVTRLLRASNQVLALRDVEEYRSVMRETCVALNESEEVTEEGLVGLYEMCGGLARDADSLGIGSVDDYVTGMLSVAIELQRSGLEELDVGLTGNPWMYRALKAASFLLHGLHDTHFDHEVCRISDLLLPGTAPRAFTEPGWPAAALRTLQQLLADGATGVIPKLRLALSAAFDVSAKVAPRAVKTLQTEAAAPLEGSVPPLGSLSEIEAVQNEVQFLRQANIIRSHDTQSHEEVASQIQAKETELIRAALAHLVESYDGVRELTDEVASIGLSIPDWKVTARFTNLRLTSMLPQGKGEVHPSTAALRRKEERARLWRPQVRQPDCKAQEPGEEEPLDAGNGRPAGGTDSFPPLTAVHESDVSPESDADGDLRVELELFEAGMAAREAGNALNAEKSWSELLSLRSSRWRDTDAEAVCLNNLAVVFAGGDARRGALALELMQRACDVIHVHSFCVVTASLQRRAGALALLKEHVSAEGAGAVHLSAAPRDIPRSVALCYVGILTTYLTMLGGGGQVMDDAEEDLIHGLRERLAGVLRHSLTDVPAPELINDVCRCRAQGVPLVLLCRERTEALISEALAASLSRTEVNIISKRGRTTKRRRHRAAARKHCT